MSKVSFVLPAYKRRFLKESIDSILAQTCRDFELVIVDDKSPEGLYEVIREYPWERGGGTLPDGGRTWEVDGIPVRYYQNPKNLGGERVIDAWHHALTYAKSDLCVLAGDDDLYFPGFLQEMLRLHNQYPRCDMFFCRSAIIDGNGKWKSTIAQWGESQSQIQIAYYNGAKRIPIFAQDVLFRKSALMAIGGFVDFPQAWYSDDATWMLLSKNGAAVSREILFCWRDSGLNLSTTKGNALARLHACEKFRSWLTAFVQTLSPTTPEEHFLASRIVREMNETTDGVARGIMRRVAPLWDWYKLFRAAPQRGRLKRRFVYDRFPRLCALRMLLPHFSAWRRK